MELTEVEVKKFLQEWFDRSTTAAAAHYDMASQMQRKYYIFGVPVIALTTLVSTATFATLGESDMFGVQIATGCAALLASVMSAIQTFLKYGERAEQHRTGGVRYSALKRELESKKLFWDQVDNAYINDVIKRWDVLNEDCPTVPKEVWIRMAKKNGCNGNKKVKE